MTMISANGTSTFYRRKGTGQSVWILHGGLEDGRNWEWLFDALSLNWTVTMPDRRGHGRTSDTEGEYSYSTFSDDVIAMIEVLEEEPVTIIGFSDGAIIGLELAHRRTDIVRSVVAISGNLFGAAVFEEAFKPRISDPKPDSPQLAAIRDSYAAVSPDGREHWPVIYKKVCVCGMEGSKVTLTDLEQVTAPVLLIFGDDDVMTLEHSIDLYRSLEYGQLAVLPGTTHLLGYEKPALVEKLISEFLENPKANRIYPMRRS